MFMNLVIVGIIIGINIGKNNLVVFFNIDLEKNRPHISKLKMMLHLTEQTSFKLLQWKYCR